MKIIYLITSCLPIACIIGCLIIALKNKNVIINNNTCDKPWKMFTWISGIFIAGMGVALVCNVPNDLSGYLNQGYSPFESIFLISMYNGIPVWALYSFLGYWYIKHIDSKIGKIAAMASTVLGMSVSLWTGTQSISRMIGISDTVTYGWNFLIAAVICGIALISARFNYLKQVSRISMTLYFICFLLIVSTSTALIDKLGGYPSMTYSFTRKTVNEYFTGSTAAFWWGWWILWAPTVARWLAHISNGKTIRQYIGATVLFPAVLCTIWTFISFKYTSVISTLDIIHNTNSSIAAIAFIITGIMFMAGTLDSDCKIFTTDLSELTNGFCNSKFVMLIYGFLVLLIFGFYNSGLISAAYSTNFVAGSSMIFVPLYLYGFKDLFKK